MDGSPNSIPPELLNTKRETMVIVEPMSREQIESIPEFERLIALLKSRSLDDPVWKVLGGSPALYVKLEELARYQLARTSASSDEIDNSVKDYLLSLLSDSLNDNILNSSSATKEITKIFNERKATKILKTEFAAIGLSLDYPNKVFREVKIEGRRFVVPSSPAISLILSENVQDDDQILTHLRDTLFTNSK